MNTLPEIFKIVRVQQTVAANAFTMSDYISCKNAHKVWFLINHAGATDTDITFALSEATDVAAGTAAAVTATFPIWEDADAGTSSDTLVRLTDAASLAIDPATEGASMSIIEWDPSKHTAGYDCIAVSGSGGNAANTVTIFAFIETRYPQATPPSAITD
jgi:hypothetical protein